MSQSSKTVDFEKVILRRPYGNGYSAGTELNRAKIPGGWLLWTGAGDSTPTFVPDPQHKWDGSSLP